MNLETYRAIQDQRVAASVAQRKATDLWAATDEAKNQHPDCPFPACSCLGTTGNCAGYQAA